MKLAAVHPEVNFDIEQILSKGVNLASENKKKIDSLGNVVDKSFVFC